MLIEGDKLCSPGGLEPSLMEAEYCISILMPASMQCWGADLHSRWGFYTMLGGCPRFFACQSSSLPNELHLQGWIVVNISQTLFIFISDTDGWNTSTSKPTSNITLKLFLTLTLYLSPRKSNVCTLYIPVILNKRIDTRIT